MEAVDLFELLNICFLTDDFFFTGFNVQKDYMVHGQFGYNAYQTKPDCVYLFACYSLTNH